MSSQQIRKYLTIITETALPEAPVRTKDKTALSLSEPTSRGTLAPAASQIGKRLSAAQGQQALRGIGTKLDHEAVARVMGKLPASYDDPGGETGPPEDRETTTLPAVINTLPATMHADINWHKLTELPNYRMVIGAFRPLFQNVLGMNPSEIHVATSLTTGIADMRKLMAYIGKNGVKDDDFSLEAFDIDPRDYHIERAFVYYMGDEVYLLLNERLGSNNNLYVYSAPKMRDRAEKLPPV